MNRIGTCPVDRLAPLDYRYALDAAMSVPEMQATPLVRCNVATLEEEVCQRLPNRAEAPPAAAVLWVEPLAAGWKDELQTLVAALNPGAPLVVVASRPLARLLPERASWGEQPAGLTPGTLGQLRRALHRARCPVQATYGIHSLQSIGLHALSRWAERWGWPDLGDRLHFLARLRYCMRGPLAAFATVALIISRKQQNKAQPVSAPGVRAEETEPETGAGTRTERKGDAA
ncbi:MAG: hypothetical protein HC884_15285 [Chloroflexaceae bacterium]|nr:hypothetical protein [Chloroflexaceae bacterium]